MTKPSVFFYYKIYLISLIVNPSLDQEQLDKEINNLRKELKDKVSHLNNLEGMYLFLVCIFISFFGVLSLVLKPRHLKNIIVVTLVTLKLYD